jgi:poly(A) polymerase
LRLRADVQEVDERLADWWQEFSMASDSEREDLVQAAKEEQQAKPRVRRAPKPQGEGAAPRAASCAVKPAAESDAEVPSSDGESAPKKRRRRRRKPGGGEQGAGSAE